MERGDRAFEKKGFVRISALLWADILVSYALFVMQDYLTDVWKISFTHAAGILNIWGGISKILPLVFLFLVDQFLGNFFMLVVSSTSYSVGMGLLAMSMPPVLGKCKKYEPECIGDTQRALFYTGMALIAVGMAGNMVSREAYREVQDNESDSRKGCLKIPAFILVAIVPIIGAIALPYIKPWKIRFGIPAICTLVATIIFMTTWFGKWKLKKDKPGVEGSPVTNVFRVYVAAILNMCKPRPDSSKDYYKKEGSERFKSTRFLRCLEKAAIKSDDEDKIKNKWKACYVEEVEEAKIAVRMVPMWMTFIICGVVSSIANTYFVEQAKNMDRHVGKWKLPAQALLLFFEGSKNWVFPYFVNCILQKKDARNGDQTANGEGTEEDSVPDTSYKKVAPAIGMGFGMVFSVLCCIIAAVVERKRIGVIRRHDLLDKPDEDIPMAVWWLLFQFFLLAGLDTCLESSVEQYYQHQSPDSMKKYLPYFTKGVTGLGFIASALCVYVVGEVRPSWFQFTLNKSRLDKYYWVLAGMSAGNLVVFVVVATCYRYKDKGTRTGSSRGGGEGSKV